MAKLDKRRSFLRQSGFRDARLIGIACEGSLTELQLLIMIVGAKKPLVMLQKKLNKKDICSQLVGHALKPGFCFICFQIMILTFHD